MRSSYTDESRTLLTTVGVAVMPDQNHVDAALGSLSVGGHERAGLRVVPFPHTVAADWSDARRQETSSRSGPMPYAILQVSGWADGRTMPELADAEPFRHADTLLDHLSEFFVHTERPCEERGVRC
ncbi:hypothetical protein NE235_21535 [Actinoallomurus spadix]|nr:hypothetical protein [Actinoallomurus spadix]MCO5988693.1 hypothetical protein [Actinoallomurus spadix]